MAGLIDLFGDARAAAQAAADRLFQKEKDLFYQICLDLGLDVAQAIFATRPEIALSDKQRDKLKKLLLLDANEMFERHEPEYKRLRENAKASELENWHKRVCVDGGTPEYRKYVALLAVIVREQTKKPADGKRRYARTMTRAGIRQHLRRSKT